MSTREPASRSVWERFCREEAREVALTFLDKVRRFKGRHPSVGDVHDTVFTNEFSAAFLEETAILMAEGGGDSVVDGSQRQEQRSTGRETRTRGRWWNNIFKWPKLSRGRSTEAQSQRTRPVVMEGVLQMLNLADPMQVTTWQCCKLCLLEEQGNYQLEVFTPPKSSTPKMSLFCFLIEEVRSTSALEMPDSTSCFVIKSQNHGEYVFDAGTELMKLKWIRTVLQYSGRPSTSNGRLSDTSDSQQQALFSQSAAMPRLSPLSVSSEELVRTLAASPTVYGRRGSTPTEHRLALAAGGGGGGGEGSALCNVTLRGGGPGRQRKARSMFVETALSAAQSSGTSRFPYADIPQTPTTPPPLPRRLPARYRPTSPSLQPVGGHTPHQNTHQSSNGRVPPANRRKHSQPTLELPSPLPDHSASGLHSPGTLESCSQSSSTSALHPVSIAAVQRSLAAASTVRRRGSASSSSPPELGRHQQHLSTAAAAAGGQGRERKISAPVFPCSRRAVDETTRPAQQSADVLLSTAIEAVLESGGREEEEEEEGEEPEIPAPEEGEGGGEDPVIETSDEQQPPSSPQREHSGDFRTSLSSSPSSSSDRPVEEEGEEGEAGSTASNPIYVETTEGQQVAPTTAFTLHPYESWATSHRDVDNLRALAQFPWFHGMISRINASQIVLVNGEEGLGDYLVRQSESREGDFVLTFNYHNRAKHLRMTVDESGCNIQHLWFDNVASMLEYFKTNSIPLESFWLNDDVKLTTYIDRAASDAFRTTTVVNVDRLSRVPPRRSSSLHLGIAQATQLSGSSSPGELQPSPSSPLTSSLPHSARNSTGWRQFFRSQRSSSAGNVGRIQRRHSANAGSVLDTQQQRRSRTENAYIARNY